VNLPVGLLGIALTADVLREQRISAPRRPSQSFDLAGAVLTIVAAALLFLAFERVADGHLDALSGLLAVAALAAVGAFIAVERWVPDPLLALSLFRARGFSCGAAAVAFVLVVTAAASFLLPFYLQDVLGYSPLQAGVLLTPTAFGIVLAGPLAGMLSTRFRARTLATGGLVCAIIAVVLLAQLRPDSHYADAAVRMLLLGIGLGLFHPPNNTAVLGTVPRDQLGVASAFLSAMRMLGQFLGASLSAEIVGDRLGRLGGLTALHDAQGPTLHDQVVAVFVEGQTLALQAVAALALIGLAASAMRGISAAEEAAARATRERNGTTSGAPESGPAP
jgi:hypothetical protein